MRLLDLYCGEGLAAWGYWQSGCFSEIVGVDINDFRTSYSFDFIRADALSLTYEFLLQFDFIHASPPCQAYSKLTPDKSAHPRLIIPTHRMLTAAGMPYVIENVEGSGAELRPNLSITGACVGLPMLRRRYFHISTRPGAKKISLLPGAHLNSSIDAHKINSDRRINVHSRTEYVSRSQLIAAFGLKCIPEKRLRNLTSDGIKQGIPPLFTKLIAQTIVGSKFLIG